LTFCWITRYYIDTPYVIIPLEYRAGWARTAGGRHLPSAPGTDIVFVGSKTCVEAAEAEDTGPPGEVIVSGSGPGIGWRLPALRSGIAGAAIENKAKKKTGPAGEGGPRFERLN
jgi:hypothetical protein